MAFTERVDHGAIGVHEAGKAAFVFRDVLGGEFVGAMEVPDEGFRFVQYRYPNRMKIELMEPSGQTGFLTKFLERRGEGVHHLSFKVADIEASLGHLQSKGIDPVHVILEGPWKEAFILPRQAHGVLIQLLEMPATST